MAGATLTVDVIVNAAKAAAGLNDTANRFEAFAGKAAKVFAGAFAADKIVEGIKHVVSAAADLEQAVGGTDKVFGASAQKVHQWASDQDDSIRLGQRAWEQYATAIGASLRATGQPMSVVADETHNLMQVSADFAATFGRDIGDVANAVRAALSGEYDSLQNMGVAISGHIVDLEAQKIAMETGASATDDAVKAQAAYNVIVQQGALYSGQAASEATSFTGRLDDLKAKLDDAAGAIGGPLLNAFGGLIDQASAAIPFLTGVATVLATMLGWVLQLPGPLQAGAAALAAFALAANAGWIAAAVSGFQTLAITAMYARDAFVTAGGGIKGIGAAASSALGPLRSLGAAIGPGLAIGAAVVVITALIDKLNDAGDAFDAAGADLSDVTTELRKTGGAWTDTAREMYNAKFVNTDAFKELVAEGFSANEVLKALTGTYDEWYDMQARDPRGMGLTTDTINQVNAYRDQAAILPQLAKEQGAFNELTQSGAEATSKAETATQSYADTLKDLQGTYQKLANETEANRLLTDSAAATDRASRAAEIFNTRLDQSLGRNRAYQQTTLDTADAIAGVADAYKTAAEAGQLNADALAAWDVSKLAEAGDKSRALAGATLDLTSQYGEFVTQAYEAARATGDQAAAIDAAHVAASTFRTQFVDAMTAAAGGSDEARAHAEQLADSLGILDGQHIDDKTFDIIARDEDALAKAKLWETVTFNPKTLMFEAQFPAAAEVAADLNKRYGLFKPTPIKLPVEIGEPAKPPGLFGSLIAKATPGSAVTGPTVNVPTAVQAPTGATSGPAGAAATTGAAQTGGTINVPVTVDTSKLAAVGGMIADVQGRSVNLTVTANTAPAWSTVQLLSSAAAGLPATVTIKGDNNPAIAAIRNVTTGAYSVTIQIKGDNNDAIRQIRNVTTGAYSVTITINGDNGPAIAAIRAVTTGYYTATVHVTAETSQFWAAFNALPTTRTVTITQQTVNAPAPPAPGGLAAMVEAPALARSGLAASTTAGPVRSASSAGSAGGVVINVNGALDPDAVARQIRRILVGRDRRIGGVEVGAMRARVGGGV